MVRFGLLPRVVVAILVGLLLGLILPNSLLAISESFRILLSGLLTFFIPLIVFAFVAAGIADFKGKVGKLLGYGVGLAYIDTIIAIGLAVLVSSIIIPALVGTGNPSKAGSEIPDAYFKLEIDPPVEILTGLILAFIIGVGATWDRSTIIRGGVLQLRDIVLWAIDKVVLPIIPFFIGFTFIKLSAEGEVFNNIPVFAGMFVLIVVMQFVWLAIEYGVAGLVARRGPLRMARAMIPAYLTGMGTMSSAVTMPVALRQAQTVDSVDRRITNFAIPLFNTVHQAAAGIGIAIGAITVSILTTGQLPSVGSLIAFIILLGVIEVGAVGIPGGSILAALGILQSTLGFGDPEIGLMLTLFAIQDSFATGGNVAGDGALTIIINRFFGSSSTEDATGDDLMMPGEDGDVIAQND